jgi:hypothetical protein
MTAGQIKPPSASSHFVANTMPLPSHARSLSLLLQFEDEDICQNMGWTSKPATKADRLFTPHLKSVGGEHATTLN